MWNLIEESSSEDETLGSSYFTNGLFRISNETKSTKDPTVLSLLQKKRLTVAVDNSLILVEDCDSVACKFISFGAEIECLAVSQSGEYVVCCLKDGSIHGIHIKGVPLFNQLINDEDVNDRERTFVDVQMDVYGNLFILCSNGSIYELSSLDDIELQENLSITDETVIMSQTAMFTPTFHRISSTKICSKINAFCYMPSIWGNSFIISCADHLFLIDDGHLSKVEYPENAKGIVKIFNLEKFLLGLTESGSLVEICPMTGVMRKMEQPEGIAIDDIRIVESNEEFIELLFISKACEKERNMKVVDFPSMKVKSELNIPAQSWIVSQAKTGVNMYFIEGYKNENNFMQTVEIKSITDTDPEQRFQKLLMRGQFDEAEDFAKTMGLGLEPLHQMRVRNTLTELAAERYVDAIEEQFETLMKQLPQIEDKNFLVSLRNSRIPDRNCLTQFLEYILKSINTNDFLEETNEINELLLRLETLRLIDPDDTNLRWQRFLEEKDMQKAAAEYFKVDVLLSCLVWSRHASSIIPKMNKEKFYNWLVRMPNTLEPFQIIQWVKHFSPCFLQAFPEEMTRFVDWCLERTRALQFSPAWPEIGLEFINNIQEIFKDMKFMFVDIRRSYHSNVEKIQKLINILEEMVILKQTYHLIISLDDYCRQSIEETAFNLLQRIQIMNLAKMVNDFLYPIFREHGLDLEETIVRYINFLANNKNLGYWQERAVTSIDLLNNEENRLNCALLILKVSPVPWSEVVMPLAKIGTTSSHPIANQILIEYKSQAIKLIKQKYGWPIDYFDFQQDRIQLVFRILKLNHPEMIVDIKTLIETSPDITYDAYIHLICRLVELGKLEDLGDLISDLTNESEQQKIILKSIEVFIKSLDNDLVEKSNVEHFLEAFKFLVSFLKDSIDDFGFRYHKMQIEMMRSVITLRNEFGMKINLKDLQKSSEEKLNEAITIIVQEIQASKSVHGVWSKASLISQAFKLNHIQIYNKICHKLDNLFVTCHFVESFCNMEVSVSDQKEIQSALELSVLMISQQMKYFDNNGFNMNAMPYDPLAFPLAFELLSKTLLQFDSSLHEDIVELLHWIEIVRRFYPRDVLQLTASVRKIDAQIFTASKMSNGHSNGKSNKRESLSMFDQFSEDQPMEVVAKKHIETDENLKPIMEFVCHALNLVTFVINTKTLPFNLFRQFLQADEVQGIKDRFFCSLDNLFKLRHNIPIFIVMQLISFHKKSTGVSVYPPIFETTMNRKILKYMLSQKDPAYVDAFIILRSEQNQHDMLDYLRSVLKNNSQRIALSTFCEMYNKLHKSGTYVVDREARLKLYYYSELCKQYPNLKSSTNLDSIQINDFLKDLEKRQLNVELVKKLCRDFGWHYQKMLIKQIKIALSSQKLDFEIKTDQFGKDEVIIKSSVESIKKICMPYMAELIEMDQLAEELQDYFTNHINVYFYELFIATIDLIEYARETTNHFRIYRNMLLLLKLNLTFKRRSIETEESDHWAKNFASESGVLPLIAHYRLPFTLLIKNFEASVGKDLTVETFETYYPLIRMHSELYPTLPPNERVELCTFFASKNSISDLLAQGDPSSSNWNLKPRNNAFLQAVLRMCTYIENPTKVFSTLVYVMHQMPSGCDQVEAAHHCYNYVLAHEDVLYQHPKFQDIAEKVKIRYPMLKTQHLLYLYGVYDDKLMQLIEKPATLIEALYHHESILGSQKKEINKLCSELADIFNIDLLSLQNKLLRNWLAFTENSFTAADTNSPEFNETVYEDYMGSAASNGTEEDSSVNDENVIRAYYVLTSWSSEAALDFLASELNSNTPSAENHMQLYECFAKLMNENSLSYMDMVSSDNYLLTRVCHFLKGLGIVMRPEVFKDADKVDILKRIWSSHNNNMKGLEVMALICLSYGVYVPQIWNGILKQMVVNKMIKHLSILVEILSTKTKLLHLPNLKLAWEVVIQDPFIHASKTRSYEQELPLTKAFVSLQRCPISTFLNLTGFAEKCLHLERPHMAAIFIAFAKESDREKITKMLANFDKRELKKNIEELEEYGVAPIITKTVVNILKL